MNTQQEEYTTYIMGEVLNGDRRTKIDLHIKKIDGLDVNVYLLLGVNDAKTKLSFAYLNIMSSTVMETTTDDLEYKRLFVRVFNVNEYGTDLKYQIGNILLDCKLALVKVRFSKLLGLFLSETAPQLSFCQAFEIGYETGVISVFEDCCVCYEKTKTLTDCKHSLCIPCWAKIERQEDEDEDLDCNKLCPICRAVIY